MTSRSTILEVVAIVQNVHSRGREGHMGRLGTDMTVVSAGWGPSGRRFEYGLPDHRKPAGSLLRVSPVLEEGG